MTTDHQQAIRTARAAINDAIDRRDSEGVAAFFLPTYHVVTARSMHREGKDQSRRSWADVFERDKDAMYGRMPDEIYVNDEWGMAEEHVAGRRRSRPSTAFWKWRRLCGQVALYGRGVDAGGGNLHAADDRSS